MYSDEKLISGICQYLNSLFDEVSHSSRVEVSIWVKNQDLLLQSHKICDGKKKIIAIGKFCKDKYYATPENFMAIIKKTEELERALTRLKNSRSRLFNIKNSIDILDKKLKFKIEKNTI